jgi:organic radical activating enzyme
MGAKYGVAPNGIFYSLQGEGHLRGFHHTFIRLAGCSVGCPGCDTDYKLAQRMDAEDIAYAAYHATPPMRDATAWITGGEPADYDLAPLITALKNRRFTVCVATSGQKRVIPPVDWLSVSPHKPDFLQRYGNEGKFVIGLNGLEHQDVARWADRTDFMYRYVQPAWINGQEDPEALAQCKFFLDGHPDWALSRQDHKYWSCP